MRARVVTPLVLLPPAMLCLLLSLAGSAAVEGAGGFLAGFLAIFSLCVSLPVGLCASIDSLASVRHRGRFASIVHQAFRVPIFLLGIAAILVGAGMGVALVFGALWWAFGKGFGGFGLRSLLGAPISIAVIYFMIRFGFGLLRLSLRRVKDDPDPWDSSDPLAKRTKPWFKD